MTPTQARTPTMRAPAATEASAVFSPCRTWRYELRRAWDASLPLVTFVGLNPSTADETRDDPTIRRCIGFAKRWGYGSIVMVNLFAFRATDPRDMRAAADPVGPENDARLGGVRGLVIAAWGTGGAFRGRGEAVRSLFGSVYALGLTKDGYPRHPLYVRGDAELVPWQI